MRALALALALPLTLAGCGGRQVPPVTNAPPPAIATPPVSQAWLERKWALVRLAETGTPDYAAALRRAAVDTVAASRTPPPPEARTAAVEAEEARFQAEVEEVLAARRAAQASKTLDQAAAICEARGDMAEAAYPSRSILGLDAIMAGRNVRNACLQGFQRSGAMPSL